MSKGFAAWELAKIAGIHRATVYRWCNYGLLTPSVSEGIRGRRGGSEKRRFSQKDLETLSLVVALKCHGVTVQRMKKILVYLRKQTGHPRPLHALQNGEVRNYLLVFSLEGEGFYLVDEKGAVDLLAKSPGQLAIVNLHDCLRRIHDGADEVQQRRREALDRVLARRRQLRQKDLVAA